MEFSTPESATLLLWTLMRGAALVVLATETIRGVNGTGVVTAEIAHAGA